MSVFETLNAINVNEHTEKKNGLTYLSWAWAWGELLKQFPDSTYTIYENKDGWNYHTDGKTAWVKTGVTVEGKEYVEYLPVMDFRNNSIPADKITSFDVNKAIQRSLTKAVARHGLGLYIYAGEDLPEGEGPKPVAPVAKKPATVTVHDVQERAEDARLKVIKALRQNAAFAYGPENAGGKLDEMLAQQGVTLETMTNAAYKAINAQIIADIAAKQGAS